MTDLRYVIKIGLIIFLMDCWGGGDKDEVVEK